MTYSGPDRRKTRLETDAPAALKASIKSQAEAKASHTPGPWHIARSLYRDETKPFTAYRDSGTPHYAVLTDKRGNERSFASEAAALAAIAKATGSAP